MSENQNARSERVYQCIYISKNYKVIFPLSKKGTITIEDNEVIIHAYVKKWWRKLLEIISILLYFTLPFLIVISFDALGVNKELSDFLAVLFFIFSPILIYYIYNFKSYITLSSSSINDIILTKDGKVGFKALHPDKDEQGSISLKFKTFNIAKSFCDCLLQKTQNTNSITNQEEKNVLNEPYKYKMVYLLEDDKKLQIIKDLSNIRLIGSEVRINNSFPNDGIYRVANKNSKFEIKDGKIIMEYFIESHILEPNKKIEIDIRRELGSKNGCNVRLNNETAPDGIYKLGFMNKIKVKNGRIV